jgi:hypothetical protein
MSKFNRRPAGATVLSPYTSTPDSGYTHEGAPGHQRDPRTELFLAAVSALAGEDSFYETGVDRDQRYRALVGQLAVDDPVWCAAFLRWLRTAANVRTAALVGAVEYVRARLALTQGAPTRPPRHAAIDPTVPVAPSNRRVVDSVLERGDEPGELLAYWIGRYGRAIPSAVKRGVADAVLRMQSEYTYLKWDSRERAVRHADVLNLCHPGDRAGANQRISGPYQHDLFDYIVGVPHRPDMPIPDALRTLSRRDTLMRLPVDERRAALSDPTLLARAGITWEALAGWLQGPMDAPAWSAVLPSMGLMAQIRNLRNLDQAGVGDDVVAPVLARLRDPGEIARSRQFPYRFYSAYLAAPSLRWGQALETALQHSLGNLPRLGGRTLILVDTSASMERPLSARSTATYAQTAALFGVALAARGEQVDLFGFADGQFPHHVAAGASVLREVERFCSRIGEVGHGTQIGAALARQFNDHDRVVVISDMQTMPHPGSGGGQLNVRELDVLGRRIARPITDLVPAKVPMYGFSLGGYRRGAMPSGHGRRWEFGGLTDATFRLIPMLEAGERARWPWEDTPVHAA